MRSIPVFKYAAWLSIIILLLSVLIWTGFIKIPASPLEINLITNKAEFSISDFATYVSSIFSTLSLIWLVVNAWQQREDLALQREEMRRNNEHQEEQAKQLRDAAIISSENLKMQKEIYLREVLNSKIKSIVQLLAACRADYQMNFHFKAIHNGHENTFSPVMSFYIYGYNNGTIQIDNYIGAIFELEKNLSTAITHYNNQKIYDVLISSKDTGTLDSLERSISSCHSILQSAIDRGYQLPEFLIFQKFHIAFLEFCKIYKAEVSKHI